MNAIPPMAYTYQNGNMVPRDRRAAGLFEENKTYRLQVFEGRSKRSHDHYFACITAAWKSLPDHMAPEFDTDEHFRKRLLIECGYCNSRQIACGTHEAAQAVAAFAEEADEYALVVISETIVTIFTAQSQKKSAMGKDKFQRSKQDCLELAAYKVGITVDELTKNPDHEPTH